jgi:hypothetical protein
MMEFLKGIAKSLVELLVLNIVLVPIMVLGPLLYVIPFFCIVANLLDNFSGLAQLYFWLGPLSCAFWMLVSCHWQTVRRARREGRLATWRESEGGMLHTVTKAAVYMFAGLFGSLFFEITFLVVFNFRPGNPYRDMLWFTILPFANFAPVILLWLSRWMRSRKQGYFITRAKNDPDLQDQLRAASLYAKNLRTKDAHCWQEEG